MKKNLTRAAVGLMVLLGMTGVAINSAPPAEASHSRNPICNAFGIHYNYFC